MRITSFPFFLIALLISSPLMAGLNPTIQVSTSNSTQFLELTNKTASAVLNDPTDPLLLYGINFTITDEDLNSIVLTCTSSSTSVVANDATHFIISGTGSSRNVKIKPKGIGYTTITIKVKDVENKTASYVLKYAASAAAANPAVHNFHTLSSSASTAIAISNEYMFVGDDEINEIRLYARNQSGAPLTKSEITSHLNLPEPSNPEVDIEASCVSPMNPNRIYWMGSLSNSNSGSLKPNRDRIFATDISGTDANAMLSFAGYSVIKNKILEWGNTHGYNLSASAADGMDPKAINGLSVEGLEFGPDNSTLYIGFRTPFVPVTNRTKALICPVVNFETWFNNGSPIANPTFGNPIELNLGGRGVRSIAKNSNNEYLIVAGAFDGTDNFALFQWSGNPWDAPILLSTSIAGLSPEGIVEVPATISDGTTIELINDYGSMDWYDDGKESKDLSAFEFQKFSSSILTLTGTPTFIYQSRSDRSEKLIFTHPNPVSGILHCSYESSSNEDGSICIYNSLGQPVYSMNCSFIKGTNLVPIHCGEFPGGAYLITIKARKTVSGKFIKD